MAPEILSVTRIERLDFFGECLLPCTAALCDVTKGNGRSFAVVTFPLTPPCTQQKIRVEAKKYRK